MSLLGSIQLGANTLRVNQLALHVVGQNIANANTPGYIREEAILTPAPTERRGGVLLGMGVRIEAVVQKLDRFLEDRLRAAVSDRADIETRENVYAKLESVLGELGDTDLSSALSNFFSSIAEILNQPEDLGIRNLAVLGGTTLATEIRAIQRHVGQLSSEVTDRIIDIINQLLEEIRSLNVRIAHTEAGDISSSDAVGLRDQRLMALDQLAEIIDIRVAEDPNGTVVVYCGSSYLVHGGQRRAVEIVLDSYRGAVTAEVHLDATQAPLESTSGELEGLRAAQNEILRGFLEELDDFARALIFEFNKQFSQGQGLNGYDALMSEFAVADPGAALDQAGLQYTPENGSFQVLVYDERSGLTQTTDVIVDLNGVGNEMTLADLAAALDAVEGISATVTSQGQLRVAAETPNRQFAFAGDTSGVLAALGLSGFFTGTSARDIGVCDALKEDPARFAASSSGFGVDTDNAALLSVLADTALESQQGVSLNGLYDRLIGTTAENSSVNQALAESARVFEATLRGQKAATSGVNLDEEAIRLIGYQQAYQATARYISTLAELLDMLVQL